MATGRRTITENQQDYGGISSVSRRALSHALTRDLLEVACEVAWLDIGQLRRLITASRELADIAEAELNGRSPR